MKHKENVRSNRIKKNICLRSFVAAGIALLLVLSGCAREKGGGEEVTTTAATYLPEYAMGDVVDTSSAEYSYSEMEEDLRILCEKYSERITMRSAGSSLDGRELYYVLLGDPDAERSIFINGGIHGREYLTPLFIMKQLEMCLENYDVVDEYGESFSSMLSDLCLCVMPMINPDGIMLSQEGLSAIRSDTLRLGVYNIYMSDKQSLKKNEEYTDIGEYLRYWKANAAGVDLNRNFPIEYWDIMNTGVSAPSAEKYKGSAPASEPETQALIELTKSLKGLEFTVSIHSQGEIIYWDCGQRGELRDKTYALTEKIAGVNRYAPYNSFVNPDATYNDWCVLDLGVPSVNIETGIGVCPLPISEFENIWQDNYLLLRELLRKDQK